MAMDTSHAGAGRAGRVVGADVVQRRHGEGAGVAGVGMLQGNRKWIVLEGGNGRLQSEVKQDSMMQSLTH